MHYHFVPQIKEALEADLWILPFWQLSKKIVPAFPVKDIPKEEYEKVLDTGDFKAKEGEVKFCYIKEGAKTKRVLLLGLGEKDKAHTETVRRGFASAIRALKGKSCKQAALFFKEEKSFPLRVAVEAILLTLYHFDYKTGKEEEKIELSTLYLVEESAKIRKEVQETSCIVEGVNLARDLVNRNADEVTAGELVKVAKQIAHKNKKVEVKTLSKKQLEKEGMGLLLAVNKGSVEDPTFTLIEYKAHPKKNTPWIAVVGKGITYDTGGLNLKPTGSMETMKDDMSGAAAVLGLIQAVSALKLPVNLLGVIPSTENAIGPASYKPGDVYTSFSGKSVEISNTDAEGRLVLADALSYIQKHYSLSTIIDLATLTGGVVVALGEEATGLFSNTDSLANALIKSGEHTHERVWRLPLYPEYLEELKSSIADIKNSGSRKASPIQGAIFLQQFVEKVEWAHLDIAGTAYLSHPKGYHQTPATGVGVRLLVHFLQHHARGE